MADYQDEEGPKGPPPGVDQNVAAFANAFENAPEGTKDWAADTANILNNYAQTRQIAEANRAAGDAMVNNLHEFKNGLVGMVSEDPAAVHTALDLVPLTVRGVINETPHAKEDGADDTHAALTKDIQGSVAHAAVVAAAERNADAARGLLSHDRIGALIDPDQHGALNAYINAQDIARGADEAGQQREVAKQQEQTAHASAHDHLAGLYNAGTAAPSFSPGWAQRLTADPDVKADDKTALMHLYGRLQTTGDAPQSDAHALTDAVLGLRDGTTNGTDMIRSAGANLTLADAAFLHGKVGSEMTGSRDEIAGLAGTLEAARSQILGRGGENGAAGDAAYQRFVNWFMPSYRQGASLNPEAENFMFRQANVKSFLPTGDDLARGVVTAERKPLSEIFGGKRV